MNNKPDFFIVGAAKSGTTALQQTLASHAAIYMSPIKEPNYFYNEVAIEELRKGLQEKLKKENAAQWINDGMQGELWNAFIREDSLYKKLFSNAAPSQKCGEASVSYLYSLKAAENIYQYNPQAKIIIILRNPAERAWSHFNMEKRMGLVSANFKSEFDKHHLISNPIWGRDPIFLSGGFYYEQVKRYLDVFPKEQVFICLYDDYKSNAQQIINKLLSFIGITSNLNSIPIENKKANEARKSIVDAILPSGGIKTKLRKLVMLIGIHKQLKKILSKESNDKLPTEYRKLLNEFYLADIEKLEKLLSINLTNWKQS
jgi:hypothetical protein